MVAWGIQYSMFKYFFGYYVNRGSCVYQKTLGFKPLPKEMNTLSDNQTIHPYFCTYLETTDQATLPEIQMYFFLVKKDQQIIMLIAINQSFHLSLIEHYFV